MGTRNFQLWRSRRPVRRPDRGKVPSDFEAGILGAEPFCAAKFPDDAQGVGYIRVRQFPCRGTASVMTLPRLLQLAEGY